jgi:hypothetical protein
VSITGYIRGQYLRAAIPRQKRRLLQRPGPDSVPRSSWDKSLADPTEFYLDCHRFFHQHLPVEVREHRAFFFKDRKGFGEDAMHVMWWLLFNEFKPANFLEIGVFRGQIISLAALLARLNGTACRVQGISPFSSAGDAGSVRHYRGDLDYLADTQANFEHFLLPPPDLLKAFSTDPEAVALVGSKAWDIIYIDGNHDYEVARQDWEICSRNVKKGGVIVLDDAGLSTSYRPPLFATAGHKGPSRLAREIDRGQFREILQVGHNRAFQRIVD